MPAMLIEVAFHDEPKDVAALKEARFRQLVARAIMKGIIRYFAAQSGAEPSLPPEPPRALRASSTGPGEVTVSWEPPASGGVLGGPALSYRLQRSAEGHGFDDGVDTGGKTSHTLKGLPAGSLVFLRLAAVNAGGESLPSPTLAVRVSGAGKAPLLLVAGFDRLDAELNLHPSYPKVGTPDRIFLEAINDGSYLVAHARALESSTLPFDACSHDAIETGAVDPRAYQLVLWQGGMGLQGGLAIGPASRARLAEAIGTAGTGLVLSGATIARRLAGATATPEDRAFLTEVLHAGLGNGSGGTSVGGGAGILEGLGPFSLADSKAALDPGYGRYEARAPDTLSAGPGAIVAARYGSGATDPPAAVQSGGVAAGQPCRLLFSFPLEAVLDEAARREILTRALAFCEVKAPPPGDGWIPGDGGAGRDLPSAAGDLGPGSGDDGCGCSSGSRPLTTTLLGAVLLLFLLGALRLPLRRRARVRSVAPRIDAEH
jgi:hypothetical protein